ncbi:hypothetical protein XENTR_v10007586 [Xenopus tropicalis]|nr:hypothetical protein XENTR_v10007586 [Xenopus tropicalis]
MASTAGDCFFHCKCPHSSLAFVSPIYFASPLFHARHAAKLTNFPKKTIFLRTPPNPSRILPILMLYE